MKNTRFRTRACLTVGGVCFLLCVGGISGCKSHSAASGPATSTQVEQAKAFLATLKSLPASERQAYVKSHQEQVQNVNRSGDPTLTGELMQMMRPSAP